MAAPEADGPEVGSDRAEEARRLRWPRRIAVGRVGRAHGVRGEVRLEAWGEVGGALRAGVELHAGERELTLSALRGNGDQLIGRFEGVADRDQAEELRGAVLEAPAASLPLPAPDEEYLFELEGCRVHVVGRDEPLGTVSRVIEDGGGLILAVEESREDGTLERLIPYVRAYLRRRDLAEGRLDFELPEGLLETCVSTS